ncbi:MAG: hypothetical protein IJU62_06410 [Muribaculaceae bacterium]|nr:hypothetical protein [Muribaculaceae bacterium]
MIDLHDYDIERIEREILWKYNDHRNDYTDCDCLLSLRKDMINKRVLAHQEEILQDIIAFNDALMGTLAYQRVDSSAKRKSNQRRTGCLLPKELDLGTLDIWDDCLYYKARALHNFSIKG